MRKVILGSLAALLMCGATASAADLSVRPVLKAPPMMPLAYGWQGFYAGINGGGGWGQTNHTLNVSGGGLGTITSNDFNASGGLIGGTFGYNYQMGQYVLGFETDVDWGNVKGTSSN